MLWLSPHCHIIKLMTLFFGSSKSDLVAQYPAQVRVGGLGEGGSRQITPVPPPRRGLGDIRTDQDFGKLFLFNIKLS